MSTRPGVTKTSLISSLLPLTEEEHHAHAEAERFVTALLVGVNCAIAASDDGPVTERMPHTRADGVHDDWFV